ncbi:MAG: ribonuclease HIII [Puniceicoccales bacterium]|jgi:ribonuclease HIII|nr:ribonuclease HIII [Puniceicoccales bacterium]
MRNQAAMGGSPLMLYTCLLDGVQCKNLQAICVARGWEPNSVAYSSFAYRGSNVHVVAYPSGKVVITGKGTEDFVRFTVEAEITGQYRLGYNEVHHEDWFEDHGGMDESGKGDLFGPLVSACVLGGKEQVRHWLDAGVRDSKAIATGREVRRLASLIYKTDGAVVEVFTLGMRKYNELYGGFGSNLNKLLAWYHSKSLANALQRRSVGRVLLDQFTHQPLVQTFYRGPAATIAMRPRAEDDPVVAAASIVARAEYLRSMEQLSQTAGETLLRGAGDAVLEQAKGLVHRLGPSALGEFAKLHFTTAQRALFS